MKPSSQSSDQSAITKKSKIHRPASIISRKIIAFQELTQAKDLSGRAVSEALHVPNSSMQSWIKQEIILQQSKDEVARFFATLSGRDLLQRIVIAAMYSNKCGSGGIVGMQEFLHNSGLDQYVASSTGALQEFWERCEASILHFGEEWKVTLSKGMKEKKITIILDEMYRKGNPCLVGIEAISNYILLEKFTEDRKATTWQQELEKATQGMPVIVDQVVSDLCGALRSMAQSIGAEHSPDLFHGQYEISKATSAGLASQERAAEKEWKKVEDELKTANAKPLRIEKMAKRKQQQEKEYLERKRGEKQRAYEEKKERKEIVRKAKKTLGEIYHPVHLDGGKLRSPEELDLDVNQQFQIIETEAKKANLSSSCLDRIAKGRRAFDLMLNFFRYFCALMKAFMEKVPEGSKHFFKETVFPMVYLELCMKRLPKKEKEKIIRTLGVLQKQFQEAQMEEEVKQALMRLGKGLAGRFQRSSSAVEGRNGALSLLLHRFHHVSEKTLSVLTIVHNYGVRRSDGTTAASRFFWRAAR